METINYKFEQFEGPLELLLTLVSRHRMKIEDIPIDLLCEQYMAYISEASRQNIELACEFLSMASELMLIKSKLLLPRVEEEEEDPRAALADALLRYKQAKEATVMMAPLYATYSGRMVKDTDEISVDKTEVSDQSIEKLFAAMKHIIMQNTAMEKVEKVHFSPLIQKPIVSVELKIIEILDVLHTKKSASLRELLVGAVSRADLIASFMGVLELIKVRRILIDDNGQEEDDSVYGTEAHLYLNPDYSDDSQ